MQLRLLYQSCPQALETRDNSYPITSRLSSFNNRSLRIYVKFTVYTHPKILSNGKVTLPLYFFSFTLFCHENHTTAIINDKTLFKTQEFELPPTLGLQTNNRLALTLPPSQLCPGKLHLTDLDFIMTSVTND